jgi:SAM-dependent methyltransferase
MIPDDYVGSQFRYNAFHSDGQVETANEDGIHYAHVLCDFFTQAKLVPRSILDVGCRTGYALTVFEERLPTTRAVGVDIVPEFVETAQLRGEARVADMHTLPFADGEFDWVFCIGSIEHAYDADLALAELFRVAREGVFLSADCAPRHVFDANPSHYTYKPGPSEWIVACQRPGWQLISLSMPTIAAADMMWASPSFWLRIQEPV